MQKDSQNKMALYYESLQLLKISYCSDSMVTKQPSDCDFASYVDLSNEKNI